MRAAAVAVLAFLASCGSHAESLRIGDINSYKAFPAALEPYRKGWRLAQEELNAAGGVNGRPVEVVSREDAARSDEAVRQATALTSKYNVAALMGGFTVGVSHALAQFAGEQKILYLDAASLADEVAGPRGNRYTFRLRPPGGVQAAMLLPEAMRANRKRWAILYPHNMYDYAAIASWRARLMREQPSVDAVFEQVVPLGKMDPWAVVRWIEDNEVQAVLSLLFGSDLREFVTHGRSVGLFPRLPVFNVLAGQPEELALLHGDVPDGWWVTGYPVDDIHFGSHARFVADYRRRWGEAPGAASVLGYTGLMAIAHAARRAKSSDSSKLVEALENLHLSSPIGPISWRKDRQSTMGTFVGQLARKENGATMVRWRMEGAVRHLPPDP